MRFICLLGLIVGLNTQLNAAGNFHVEAQVSKDHVELGESFVLSVLLTAQGNFSFPPALDPSIADGSIFKNAGFQIQAGPQVRNGSSWVNSVVTTQLQVQWELVALKSGTLTLGPFKASAKDASQGDLSEASPALTITVAKGQGLVLPPTPTPEPDGSISPQAEDQNIRDIKPDLGFPWLRASALGAVLLLVLGLLAWWALRPAPPKKIEAVRDPGQVALLELEKARQLLVAGDEAAYYKELGRIIRFYLRHRMRRPEKELTLAEAEGILQKALSKPGEAASGAASGPAAIERLQELLFANSAPQAQDADSIAPALRQSILSLEKGASWNEVDLLKAELDRAAESLGEGEAAAWYQAMLKIYKDYFAREEERFGKDGLQERIASGLEEMGPSASARLSYVLLSKRLRQDLDLEKLNRDLQKLSELIEKGVNHGKRK
jgi:hypothetical protein